MDLEKKKLQFKKNDEIVITIEDLGKTERVSVM